MQDAFPRPFGKYTLLASLGRGGMGEVYAAVVSGGIEGIQKRCVIKTLHVNLHDDREYVTRFLDEARLVVQLNQRNICSVFDVGVIDGQHYLAMDMVRGKDLRTVWQRGLELERPISPGLAVHIAAEALDALDYAHTLRDPSGEPLHIVHRDVSPQNVMVSFDGDVKVIDFGLAASTQKVEKTETNVVMGKVAYMPPEQVQGDRADARADVFAVGVMLYELLSGERYYGETSQIMLPAVVAMGTHVPTRWSALDAEMRDILGRALVGDRNRRTATAAQFAEDLRTWASRQGQRGDAAMLRREMRELFESHSGDAWMSTWSGPQVFPATARTPPGAGPGGAPQSPAPDGPPATLQPTRPKDAELTMTATSQVSTSATKIIPLGSESRPARALPRAALGVAWVAGIAVAAVLLVRAGGLEQNAGLEQKALDAQSSGDLPAVVQPVVIAPPKPLSQDAGLLTPTDVHDAGTGPTAQPAPIDGGPRPISVARPRRPRLSPPPNTPPRELMEFVRQRCPKLACLKPQVPIDDVRAYWTECWTKCAERAGR